MLPSILARQLEKGIADYIATTFPMTNEPFKGSVEKLVATKDAVYRDAKVYADAMNNDKSKAIARCKELIALRDSEAMVKFLDGKSITFADLAAELK